MKFQPPKGTKDFLSEEMIRRQYVIETIKNVFEAYGFEPLETPVFEDLKALEAKCGKDVREQIYRFEDKAGRKLGLKFDLTVPLARIVANNPQLPKPLKTYQISKVWRYEEVTRARKREFLQADIDIIGSSNMVADVECVACAVDCLKALGFKDFEIRINDRKVLDGILELIKVEKEKNLDIFRVIDKLERIGKNGVKEELQRIDLEENKIKSLMEIITVKGNYKKILNRCKKLLNGIKIGEEGLKELEKIFEGGKLFRISNMVLDFSLARGLDYYTGPIFEIIVKTKKEIGSIAGGGRYNNLIESLGGRPTPATGISLGMERIIEITKTDKLFDLPKTKVKVFVANVDEKVKSETIKIAQKLRKEGIFCQTGLMNRNLTKQLEFADGLGVPYTLIVGEKELKEKKFKLKDMKKKTEKKIKLDKIIKLLK